ncbi:unnamed protein product [Phaedon cochleariae]|uniref:Uncharacterized protein n=1 Tax=Phaedon cochleariae TaxID=80249 RepID=A0A9N9SJD6_PHACE|nr:unnamed protein product [Phaedon cochleariae]
MDLNTSCSHIYSPSATHLQPSRYLKEAAEIFSHMGNQQDSPSSNSSDEERASTNIRKTTNNKNLPKKDPKKPTPTQREKKPPPIVFDGLLTDRKLISSMIKEFTSKPFFFKFGRESTLLYMDNNDDFEILKSKLENDEVSFYTYTLKKNKSHAFVLRGLDFKPEPSEIKEDLEEVYEMKIREVFALNTRIRKLVDIACHTHPVKPSEITEGKDGGAFPVLPQTPVDIPRGHYI